jgi:hypothetical protein
LIRIVKRCSDWVQIVARRTVEKEEGLKAAVC